jgi:hypothetical protein
MNSSNSTSQRRSYLPYCDRRVEALRRLGLPSPLLAKKRDAALAARVNAVGEVPLGDLTARVRAVETRRRAM